MLNKSKKKKTLILGGAGQQCHDCGANFYPGWGCDNYDCRNGKYLLWKNQVFMFSFNENLGDNFETIRLNGNGEVVHNPAHAQAYGCGYNMLYYLQILNRQQTIAYIQHQLFHDNFNHEGLSWSRMITHHLNGDINNWLRYTLNYEDEYIEDKRLNLRKFFKTMRDASKTRLEFVNMRYCYIPMKMIIDGRLSHSVVYVYDNGNGEDEMPRDWIADPSKGDHTPFGGRNYLTTPVRNFIDYLVNPARGFTGISILANNVPYAGRFFQSDVDLRRGAGGVLYHYHNEPEDIYRTPHLEMSNL